MRSRRLLLALAVVFPMTLPALAMADTKIGYVDLDRVIAETHEGQSTSARLKQELQAKQKDIDAQQKDLEKQSKILQTRASAMSPEALKKQQMALQQQYLKLTHEFARGRAELQKQQAEALQALLQKMQPIIEDIAHREGFSMIFEKKQSGLVYAPDSLDITGELIRLYNQKHPGGAKHSHHRKKK